MIIYQIIIDILDLKYYRYQFFHKYLFFLS